MQRRASILLAAVSCVATSTALAEVASGPATGEKLAALKVQLMGDGNNYSEVEMVAQRGDKPTIYAFIRGDRWDRPQARFLKVLDGVIEKHSAEAECVVVWLTGEVDKSKEDMPRLNQSLQFQKTRLAVFAGEAAGPEGWGINGDAFVTVVVARGGKASATFGLVSTNEEDVPKVEAALDKALSKK